MRSPVVRAHILRHALAGYALLASARACSNAPSPGRESRIAFSLLTVSRATRACWINAPPYMVTGPVLSHDMSVHSYQK